MRRRDVTGLVTRYPDRSCRQPPVNALFQPAFPMC